MELEQLKPNAAIRGIVPDALVTVVSVQWFGSEALELTYKTAAGKVANELLYRHDEPRLEIVEQGRPWSFDGDGALFRLVSEAQRIRLAYLFDPVLAVHTSVAFIATVSGTSLATRNRPTSAPRKIQLLKTELESYQLYGSIDGLRQSQNPRERILKKSHPSRVRGLKPAEDLVVLRD